jgi:hypothetical protein
MPDEAREVVFPAGVPVRMVTDAEASDPGPVAAPTPAEGPPAGADVEPVQEAEGDLGSEAADIGRQAQNARSPEGGPDLLGQD